MGVWGLEWTHDRLRVERFAMEAPRILYAVKRFKTDHGDLPGTLAELVPVYLDQVPQDPFDGKELRYSREKRLVYSIGDNRNALNEGTTGFKYDLNKTTSLEARYQVFNFRDNRDVDGGYDDDYYGHGMAFGVKKALG
jgi:hypothetical protein